MGEFACRNWPNTRVHSCGQKYETRFELECVFKPYLTNQVMIQQRCKIEYVHCSDSKPMKQMELNTNIIKFVIHWKMSLHWWNKVELNHVKKAFNSLTSSVKHVSQSHIMSVSLKKLFTGEGQKKTLVSKCFWTISAWNFDTNSCKLHLKKKEKQLNQYKTQFQQKWHAGF